MTDTFDPLSSLNAIIMNTGNIPEPNEALISLLEGCVEEMGVLSGRIYKLSLQNSNYQCIAQTGRDDTAPKISTDIILQKKMETEMPVLEQVITLKKTIVIPQIKNNKNSIYHSTNAVSRMIIPIKRGTNCLGILDFESEEDDHFEIIHRFFCHSIAFVALLLIEKRNTIELFRELQEPIDFRIPEDDFLTSIILLISLSADVPYIILREYLKDEQRLNCIGQYGFPNDFDLKKLNIITLDEYSYFKTVLETGEPFVEPSVDESNLIDFSQFNFLKNLKSLAVAPIKVGESIFGTISFGTYCPYDFSPLEIEGFMSIANAIGIAIVNRRNFHSSMMNVSENIQKSTAITAVEVAQAARHEARSHLDASNVLLYKANKLIKNPIKTNLQILNSYLKEISEVHLVNTTISLDRIRDITKPPDRTMQNQNLKTIWNDAFAIVQGRLILENIRHTISGPNFEVEVYKDYLMHAFLNLILNSIDAFVRYGKKGNRQINIRIEKPSDFSKGIKFTYDDNAAGINPANLIIPEKYRNLPLKEVIFQPGVTSKKGGSGFGLLLVRSILTEHDGSINLISHRNGTHWQVEINKEKNV